jgi:hypothetical protein
MTAPPSQTQWYLARNGQQFGPLSEAELAKFIDLGHLQPTDLLWRDGFPDWRPAMAVFPNRRPAQASQGVAQQAAPAAAAAQPRRAADTPDSRTAGRAAGDAEKTVGDRPGVRAARPALVHPAAARQPATAPAAPRSGLRIVVVILCLTAVGAAIWYGVGNRARLLELVGNPATSVPTAALEASSNKDFEVPPLVGFRGSEDAIDVALQATPLWRVLKRDFKDWYGERLKQAAALAAQKKDDAAIGQEMARALVALRRQNVNYALSASFPRLKAVAQTFYENVVGLQNQSADACFEFISQGEASATVVALLQGSAHVARLQAQLTAVFEAIAEGRTTSRVYPQPHKADYDALAGDLMRRGWTQADMQLFSDERALAHAGPAKVCQMVHDWFAAQLAITDQDMQLRLLVDSLKPVVAG